MDQPEITQELAAGIAELRAKKQGGTAGLLARAGDEIVRLREKNGELNRRWQSADVAFREAHAALMKKWEWRGGSFGRGILAYCCSRMEKIVQAFSRSDIPLGDIERAMDMISEWPRTADGFLIMPGDQLNYSPGGSSSTTVNVVGWNDKYRGEWWITCKECKSLVSTLFMVKPA